MLKLVFAEAGPGPTVELEPVPEVRIDGETMRVRAVAGCLRNTASTSGPSIDVATKRWYSHRDGKYWESVVVKSAAAPAS